MPNKKRVIAGRPLKDPFQKVNQVVRTLVSPVINDIIIEDAKRHGISASVEVGVDYARLCIYEHLMHEGLITPDLVDDPTWRSLKEKGLV